MKPIKVKDLTVPLSEYATVSSKATLFDAIEALEDTHKCDQSHYRHRAILVYDDRNRVIGKLGLFDILEALESKYSEIGDLERFAGVGLSSQFIRSIFKRYSFWSRPLDQVCEDAAELMVENIMHILSDSEYIEEDASLDEAIHQLIMGRFQSLIVTRGEEIVGIIKLSDIFREVSLLIRNHRPAGR